MKQTAEGYEITLEGSHGLSGSVTADRVYLELQPGIPSDSQYLKFAGA